MSRSLEYSRQFYNVPARRGAVVFYRGRRGKVVSAINGHIRIKLDGDKQARIYHPTDEDLLWEQQQEASEQILDGDSYAIKYPFGDTK